MYFDVLSLAVVSADKSDGLSGQPALCTGMVGLAPKWVRLDSKLDKSGTFSDQISVHLAR